jgi:hypothetical protein
MMHGTEFNYSYTNLLSQLTSCVTLFDIHTYEVGFIENWGN